MATVVVKVVLGEPDRVKTKGLGPVGLHQHVLVKAFFAGVKLREKAGEVEKGKFHYGLLTLLLQGRIACAGGGLRDQLCHSLQ
jgi:hypothetical protein